MTHKVVQLPKSLFRIKEAAHYSGLSARTIRRYVEDKSLPSVKVLGCRLIRRDDLHKWIDLHSRPMRP